MSKLVPCRFRVPCSYNNGASVPENIQSEIREALVSRFGGYTVLGTTVGAWRGGNGVQTELCIGFEVSVPPDSVEKVRSCVYGIGRILGQECMYLDIGQPSVELVDTSSPVDGDEYRNRACEGSHGV